jgi:signal transduction histidine kinase
MEVELRQAQKLESVGRLAAGVAHEINTPIQFVADSCTFLQDAVGDLDRLLAAYRATVARLADGTLDAAAAVAALAEADEGADAGYLLDEMPKAVARSVEGLDRVATIVRSLKEFAHPERPERSPADLNRAIATTLTIARNEYKYVADARTELGDVPPVDCHIGALNQAILNIIVNGAHAIEAAVAGTDRRGEIVVTTACDGEHGVVVTISDTGTGIAPEILDKIFDPFFTTKAVGKGTGQGLALVHAVVVEQHGGKVEVETEVGVGTTFRLRLPLAAPAAAIAAAA